MAYLCRNLIEDITEGYCEMTETRWEYIHSCGKPAFYSVRQICNGDRISSKPMRHLDGSRVEFAEKIVCGSCGDGIPRELLLTCRFIKKEL